MRFWISWKEYAPDNRPLTDPPSEAGFAWWDGAAAVVFYTDLGWSMGMLAALKKTAEQAEYRTLGGEWSRGS